MSFVMNGVEIPENVANAFSFNGVDITDVFFNGTLVWSQSLFSATWSGSSTASELSNSSQFLTSGSLVKYVTTNPNSNSNDMVTKYASINSLGEFTSSDSTHTSNIIPEKRLESDYLSQGIDTLSLHYVEYNFNGSVSSNQNRGYIKFDLATKTFSVNSGGYPVLGQSSCTWNWPVNGKTAAIQISGGNIRAVLANLYTGALAVVSPTWVTLN